MGAGWSATKCALGVRMVFAGAAGLVLASCASPPATDEAALAAGVSADPNAIWPHEASDIPPDPRVVYGVLDNGMRYAIVENETPPETAAVRLLIDAGSLFETDDQLGIAHYIEHMAFNGTTNVPEGEMVPLLERYGLAFGPDTNAFASFDRVGYLLNLPSVEEEVIDTALFLMRETASEMLFDPGAIERERGVILSEERFRNTPDLRRFQSSFTFYYPGVIAAERFPIGTVEVIEAVQREDFVAFYEDFYTPERAVLVVAGDVDAETIEAKIQARFSDWAQPADAPDDPGIGALIPYEETAFGSFYDPEARVIVSVQATAPIAQAPLDTRAQRRADLIIGLANAMLERRLDRIVNAGAAPFTSAGASAGRPFEITESISVSAVSAQADWPEALSVLEQELRRALTHGFTRAELDEQLANRRTALRNAAEQAATRQNAALADGVWDAALDGRVFSAPDEDLAWFEQVEPGIALAEVEAAFREAWERAAPAVFVSFNEELENPEAQIAAVWEASRAQPVEPLAAVAVQEFAYTDFGPAGSVVEEGYVEDLDFHTVAFDNGVRLNVKSTDFEDGVIRVRIEFGAGSLAPEPTPGLARALSSGPVFEGGGLGAHDRDALQALLAGRSVSYSLAAGGEAFVFTGVTTPGDFTLQMQLLTAFMADPGWRESGLSQYKAAAQEQWRAFNAQALQVAIQRGIRAFAGDDPRFGAPTPQEVEGLTMEAVRAYLSPALASAPIEVTIVGDVDVETAVAETAATLGALPARDGVWPDFPERRRIDTVATNGEARSLRFNGQPNQAMANTIWRTDDGEEARRARVLDMMRAVYDLKATDRFREQEGATYSAITAGFASPIYEDYGLLWEGIDVAIDDVSRMFAITDELAAALINGDISEDEMQRARQPILEQIEENQTRNPFWLGALSQAQCYPETLERIRTARADYQSITAEEIAAAARAYLRPDRAFRFSVLPRSEGETEEPA